MFAKKVLESRGKLIYLVQAKSQGKQAWFYLQVENKLLPEFKEKLESGNIDLEKYGNVLLSGWGKEPPASALNELKAKLKAA